MIAEAPDLASFEASIYRSRFDDGLLDLLGGSAIALIGLGWLTEFILAAVGPVVVVLFWPLLRKKITAPRIGEVEFSTGRKALLQRGMLVVNLLMVVSALLGLVVFLLWQMGGPGWRSFLHVAAPLWPGILLALVLAAAAATIKASRFYGYGLFVLVVTVVASGLLRLHPGVCLLLAGVPVAVSGALLLARFVRQNPVLPQGS